MIMEHDGLDRKQESKQKMTIKISLQTEEREKLKLQMNEHLNQVLLLR